MAYKAAQQDWASSKLRGETGANAPPAEIDEMVRRYFPLPGEGPDIIKQKAQARAVAEEGMKRAAGANYKYAPAAPQKLPSDQHGTSAPPAAAIDQLKPSLMRSLAPAPLLEHWAARWRIHTSNIGRQPHHQRQRRPTRMLSTNLRRKSRHRAFLTPWRMPLDKAPHSTLAMN